jgi:hypothetical protein
MFLIDEGHLDDRHPTPRTTGVDDDRLDGPDVVFEVGGHIQAKGGGNAGIEVEVEGDLDHVVSLEVCPGPPDSFL